jgi:hypothetical protein
MRRALLAALAVLCTSVGSCGEEPAPRTQVTLRIQRTAAVDRALVSLQVRALRNTGGAGWKTQVYPRDQLRWPVDVHLVPPARANDEGGFFEVAVAALGSANERLVEQRVLIAYARHEQRLIGVVLEPCGDIGSAGALCEADPQCGGNLCQTCIDGDCMARPEYGEGVEPPAVPEDDEAPLPEPDAGDAGRDARGDAAGDASDASGGGAGDLHDAEVPDSGPVPPGPEDAAVVDAYVPPNPCDHATTWVSAEPTSTVASDVVPQSMVVLEGASIPQYICQHSEPDAQYPGKANGTGQGTYLDGCWYARNVDGVWLDQPKTVGELSPFQALVTLKPQCVHWIAVPASAASAPAGLIATGKVHGADVYSCRIDLSNPLSTGKHIGRWSGVPGEPCYVQYFSTVESSLDFEAFARVP